MLLKKICSRLSLGFLVTSLVLGITPGRVISASLSPRNIIIMIGDGMGYNQPLASSYFRFGAANRQVYDGFTVKYAVSTSSANGWGYDSALAWNDFGYVKTHYTDSAAAATAMATGVKTYDAGVGVDVYGNPVQNVLEAAEYAGKSTGVVTTVEISHGTPAGFVAHNIDRDDYLGIAQEMILESKTDVIMGAGNPWYDDDGHLVVTPVTYKYVGGQTTWDALVAGTVQTDSDSDGLLETATLIQTNAQFESLMSGPTPERVIGIARIFTTLQQRRSGDAMADPYVASLNWNVPTLAEMSLGAINVLDNNPHGFVLMIEGGAIDWAAHSNQPGRMIEEQIDFDHAVEAVVSWVEAKSDWHDTLLIVTGDHETGYLWGPGSSPNWVPLVNNGVGELPGMQFNSINHTNSLVPFYTQGDSARLFTVKLFGADPHRGFYIDNTSIGMVIFKLLDPDIVFLPVIER